MSKSIAFLSLERRIDALFARYTRPGSPGAVVAVMQRRRGRDLQGLRARQHRARRADHAADALSHRLGEQAVHRRPTALMLAAEGKLKLSDPPHKYLRELKPLPVTIDQMMRNSSGLPDFLELLRLGGHGLDKPARAGRSSRRRARNGHLNFAPGSRFLYSNTNFLLLGHYHRAADREEAGRRPGRAHLQAARHDQHHAGGRDRHGDPQPRHRLSRRRQGGLPPRRAMPIRRAAKAASPRRSRTC